MDRADSQIGAILRNPEEVTPELSLHLENLLEMRSGYIGLAAKYGQYLGVLVNVESLAKLFPVIDVLAGGYEVYEAVPGQHMRTTFEVVGSIFGGSVGGTLATPVATAETIGTGGVGAPAGLATEYTGIILGAAAGRTAGDIAYEKLDSLYNNRGNGL